MLLHYILVCAGLWAGLYSGRATHWLLDYKLAQHVHCPIKICKCQSPHLIDSSHLCLCPSTGEFSGAWVFYVASGSSVRFAVRGWAPSSQMPSRGMENYRLWDFYDSQLQKRMDDAGCLSLRYLRRSRFCVHSIHTGAACRDAGVCLDLSVYWVCQYLCVSGHRRLVRSPADRPSMVSHPVRRLPSVSRIKR